MQILLVMQYVFGKSHKEAYASMMRQVHEDKENIWEFHKVSEYDTSVQIFLNTLR